jgi:predicted CopG family antitoxin
MAKVKTKVEEGIEAAVRGAPKTDIKVQTFERMVLEVRPIIREFVTIVSGQHWLMADKANYMYVYLRYTPKQIDEVFKTGFCEEYDIPRGEKHGEKGREAKYPTFANSMGMIIKVACRVEEEYKKLRESGKAFSTVWAELVGSKKRLKDIAEGKESRDHRAERIRKELEKDAAEGVGNAAELLASHTDSTPNLKVVKREEEKGVTYSAPNEDLVWVQGCRKICRQSPELFVRMIKSCMDNGYISEVSYNSIKEDLLK